MESTAVEDSGPVLPSCDVEGISKSPRSSAATELSSMDQWPAAPYVVEPTMFENRRPQCSEPAPQAEDSIACQNTVAPQQPQPATQGSNVTQSMNTNANGSRPLMGSSCPGDQQARPFYTGDIADAYDESFSFWNILEQDLEQKEIKLEPSSPPWTEADSTSCSPYGAFGSYATPSSSTTPDHHQTLRYRDRRPPMALEAGPTPGAAASCYYYDLQPVQQPNGTSRDPMMCPSASCWPMDLAVRDIDPAYHCPISTMMPPPRFHHSAAEWGHHREPQPQFSSASAGAPRRSPMSRNFQSSSYSPLSDACGFEMANGVSWNQGWHGQQGGDISPVSSGATCGPLSPTDALLRRFPYVGPREDAMATSHQHMPEPSPLMPPATWTTSSHGTSTAQGSDGSRLYQCNGTSREKEFSSSLTENSGHDAVQTRTLHATMAPPVTMTTLLPTTQQQAQLQQPQPLATASSAPSRYPRLSGLLERSPQSQPPRSWVRHPPLATPSMVALNGSLAGVPSSQAGAYSPRFGAVPTYYNAVMQPLSVVTQAPPRKSTGNASPPASSKAQAAGHSRLNPPAHTFPRPNLTLLLTPTARPALSAAPASILIRHPHQPSSSHFRHPVAPGGRGAAATSVHVGRLPAPQQQQQHASTSAATPDSATKPRRSTAERSHPAVNYALRSLKIGPFLVEVGDPNVNLGYKFKIIFSKRRFMYEFESMSPTEEEGLRLSCVIVPFQSLQALRCEHDYILVQVHSRPVMFLGRRTRKGGTESATSTSSLSDHLERYPVHKVQLNESNVVSVRHLLWQYNPRFHELMLRRISDQETKLDDPLPPYGAPGRSAWRSEVTNRAAKRIPAGRRRGLVARSSRAGEGPASGQLPSGGAGSSSRSLVPFSSSSSSSAEAAGSPSCACRVSCRVARCSCAKARTRCEPRRCSCLACDNPLNLLEAVGIALSEAQADPCLMQAVFQVSDLPWYLCQQVRLNCCPESVMVRECIPGPMSCPRCGRPAQYSWCANTLFHGTTNHCAACVRCNLFAGEHCQACNSCYYFTGNDKNCPRCRRNQGAQAARKRTVAPEAAVAGAATSTMRIVSVESLADEQPAQTPPATGQPLSLPLPPPSLGDAQVTEQEQAGTVVEELPQEPGADVVILDEVDEPATSDGQPIVEEPEVPDIGAITEGEKVELVSGDSLQSNPDQLIMDC